MTFGFGSVDALQPNAGVGAFECVTIDNAWHHAAECPFGNWLFGLHPPKANHSAENYGKRNSG